MKWLNFSVQLICWMPSFLATFNPYRTNVELLNHEPVLGICSKNELASVEELWLDQKVDHFDKNNNRTWKMVSFYHTIILNMKKTMLCFSVIIVMPSISSPMDPFTYLWEVNGPLAQDY